MIPNNSAEFFANLIDRDQEWLIHNVWTIAIFIFRIFSSLEKKINLQLNSDFPPW